MDQPERYGLTDPSQASSIIGEMSKVFSLSEESGQRYTQAFTDTFDWRLHRQGLVLVRQAGEYRLCTLADDHGVCGQPWPSRRRPRFWWDFDPGPLRERLADCIGVRALIPLVTVERHRRTLSVLNRDAKTVVRVHFDSPMLLEGKSRSPLPGAVTVHPIRGYRRHPLEVARFLANLGLPLDVDDLLETALKAVGKSADDYSTKLDLQLDPSLKARDAAARILSHLLGVIVRNEPGLKADIDTEFLHDFRVSIRRTRSALSQLKGIFPVEVTQRFRQAFSALGKLTNRLRDLDVYMLEEDRYRGMLPEAIRPGLDALFVSLQAERKREFRKVSKALDEPMYGQTVADWGHFLDLALVGRVEPSRDSERPAVDLARKSIRKRHRKVIGIGRAIDGSTPDPELHRLRIECKKLRYSLEFFASLFPQDDIALAIGQLKRLQDNLGEFNDLYVQQMELRSRLEGLDPKRPESMAAAAAVGGLVTALYLRQTRVRQAFAKTFDGFAGPEYVDLFQRLFGKVSQTPVVSEAGPES